MFFSPLLGQEEAETKAARLTINGFGLHTFPAEYFKYAFGPEGRAIYDIVHCGDYSYVSYTHIVFIKT